MDGPERARLAVRPAGLGPEVGAVHIVEEAEGQDPLREDIVLC
jgi:hypothetical protein